MLLYTAFAGQDVYTERTRKETPWRGQHRQHRNCRNLSGKNQRRILGSGQKPEI